MDIPRQRLCAQYISAPIVGEPSDVVARLCASQAQDFAGAKWAVGLRLQGAGEESIEQAFTQGSILRTHVLRPTWHFVTPADIRWMLELTAPNVRAISAYMYRKHELDNDLFHRSNDALAKALQGGHQLMRDELKDALQREGINVSGEYRMGLLMMRAELDEVVCSGARRGKQFTYALLAERAPHARVLLRDEALAELSRRYFISRGPATVHDFAKWSGLTVTDARKGLEAVKDQLQTETVQGKVFWFATPVPARTSPSAYLLSIFDEYVSSYKDRSAIVDSAYTAKLSALGNDLTYIVVLDGQVVGTWKRTIGKDVVIIERNIFTRLSEAEEQAIASAAQQYGGFHGLRVELV